VLASDGVINIPEPVPKPLQCIVAVARNGVIGKAGKLPWHIPEDLAWFMDQTAGGVMIEGPACYAELGKALPGRGTVVISRDPSKVFPGAERVGTLTEAIAVAEQMKEWPGPTWITGGERIYAEGMPLCERLLITRIERDFDGDRFFPADWQKHFTKLVSSKVGAYQGLGYAFEIWER
jgi:dihydrofolate reductase